MKLVILFAAVFASLTQASTDTSAHHRVTRQTGECSTSGKKESLTECCGRLFKYSYYGGLYVTYTYTLSQQEISAQCCREDFIYTGAPSESLSQAKLDANYPGHCYCDDTASECQKPEPTTTVAPTTTAEIDPCTIDKAPADNSECCGRLFLYDYGVQKFGLYLPTPQESSGSCCRVKQMTYDAFVNYPEETPGECYCDSSETSCFNPTTTATPTTTTAAVDTTTTTPEPTTTTTPEPTTTTTPEPTTTTPEPTTTTTPMPTTTTTPVPTTTTTPVPTTTTTPMPTTSTTPAPLCPVLPVFEGRVLGGTAVDACTIDGVLKLGTENRQLCNGVFVFDTNGPVPVPSVYVPKFCKTSLDSLASANIASLGALTGEYNSITFDPSTDIVLSQDVSDSIVSMLPTPGLLESGSCQTPACAYDPSTMSSAINFDDCFLTSFGADSVSGGAPTTSGTLNKVTVTKGTGCTLSTAGAECFEAPDTNVKSCLGDVGAPVYCALNTGETVLYGLVDLTPSCDQNGKFPVLPIAA